MSPAYEVVTFSVPLPNDRATLLFHHEARRRKVETGQRFAGEPAPTYPKRVSIPEWLKPDAKIQLAGGGHSIVTVIAADAWLTVVQGTDSVWAIDTSIVAESWEVAP